MGAIASASGCKHVLTVQGFRMALDGLENESANQTKLTTMFDPRNSTTDQYRADWSISDQSSQALALAQLALTMAKATSGSQTNLVEDATRCLPGAHRLLRRALAIIHETPLDEEDVPEEKFYTYDELCSGETKSDLPVGRLVWKPLAKEGSSFRKLLIEYAQATVRRDLKSERPCLDEHLCDIVVSFEEGKEDQRGWLIYCISNQQYPSPHRITHNEACDLVNTACRRMPKNGKRTMQWAEKMITEGAARIADQRYKCWMAESKDGGLSEDFVARLISFRSSRDRLKGNRTKKRA